MSLTALSFTVRALLERGVIIPDPHAVFVDESVMPERVAPGVVLHPGTRLMGNALSIGPQSDIGKEGPATLDDCQLGHSVSFKAGYAHEAVMLDGASMGAGAHVRGGSILEEQSGGAHTVGFKQTILLPYVTTGSLINFCDCLMAGGTSRKNHSEVGSSYIHFNFTPHGDKATPSLIGDVTRGVLLDQPPIFLGGQGGMVGPTRVEYGVVIGAGIIQRRDALQPGHLYTQSAGDQQTPRPYPLGRYGSIKRIVRNNLLYIGQVTALQMWYRKVRIRLMRRDPYREACRLGAIQQLDAVLKERIKRLHDLAEKMPASIAAWQAAADGTAAADILRQQEHFASNWPSMREHLKKPLPDDLGEAARARFLGVWDRMGDELYLDAIHGLSSEAKQSATEWLQAIVEHVAALEKWDCQ